MSTNKTQHYHLHAWEAGDDFLRAEINENFAAVDAALADMLTALGGKAEIMVGTYVGDGQTPRHIDLGRMPHAVLLEQADGTRYNTNVTSGGLTIREVALGRSNVTLDSTGFTLKITDYAHVNDNMIWYIYLAVFLAE